MSLPAFPCKVNLAIPEDDYWVGLGKQNMDFHQVIGELIDNSISASGMDQDGDLNPFVIEIVIKKIGNEIQLKIADQVRSGTWDFSEPAMLQEYWTIERNHSLSYSGSVS